MLNTITHGTATALPPLVLAHGLYGQARNWTGIAKTLSTARQVVAVDMRNHGQSLHDPDHSYPALARDLAEVIEDLGGTADLLGHSMGGKAAMALALDRPALLRRLIVADMAPIAYDHSQLGYAKAMKAVDLSGGPRRSEVADALAGDVPEPMLRAFFAQSYDAKAGAWMLDLDVLIDQMDLILGWPEGLDGPVDLPALFLSGGDSDYVSDAARPAIRQRFPKARFVAIPGTGHWLHAEKPDAFAATVASFLDA